MRFLWMKEVSRKGHKPLTIQQIGMLGMESFRTLSSQQLTLFQKFRCAFAPQKRA